MDRRTVFKASIFLFLSYAGLSMVFSQIGSFYNKCLFPLFKWEVKRLSKELKVTSIGLEDHNDRQIIAVKVETAENIPVCNKLLLSGYPMVSRIPVINQYLHPIIIFSILLAWPGVSMKGRLKLFYMAVPALFLVEVVDIPLLVIGQFQEHLNSLCPNRSFSLIPTTYWMKFLNSGGRHVLSILAACLVVGCFYLRQELNIKSPNRNESCPCNSGKTFKDCCMLSRPGFS